MKTYIYSQIKPAHSTIPKCILTAAESNDEVIVIKVLYTTRPTDSTNLHLAYY